jgi:polyhydroxyalkanoate synthesis regulator phasin
MSRELQQLQALAASGRPWAEQRAQMALMFTEQLSRGELTADEHRELMVDLVRSDRLDSEADDLETKTLLVTAIYAVAQVV